MECPHCRSHEVDPGERGWKCINCGHVWGEDGFDDIVTQDNRRLLCVMGGIVVFALLAGVVALI